MLKDSLCDMNLSNKSDAKDTAKEFNLIDLDSNEYELIGKEKKSYVYLNISSPQKY